MTLFRAGDRIGKYSVVERLGRGGMGTLYVAYDPSADRKVVIKLMIDAEVDPTSSVRFAREARAAAAVRHTNIVTVYDVGEHDGHPFIAMEHVAGETLAQVIKRRAPLPLERKLLIIEEICAGVYAAHRGGIIHRDLKPANIMLDAEGTVRILDFGIARMSASDVLTHEGAVLGTLNYMSPEQLAGLPLDFRSDIFSVGTVAYELLAYRQAFGGGGLDGVGHRIQAEEPQPLHEVCPEVDEAIERAIATAMRKDPAARYPSMSVMQDDIAVVRRRLATEDTREDDELTPPTLRTPVPRSAAVRQASQDHASASSMPPTAIVPPRTPAVHRELLSSVSAAADTRAPAMRWVVGGGIAVVTVIALASIVWRSSNSDNAPTPAGAGDVSVAPEDVSRPNTTSARQSPGQRARTSSAVASQGNVISSETASADALVAQARALARENPLAAVRQIDSLASSPNPPADAVEVARSILTSAERDAHQAQADALAARAPQLAEEDYANAQETLADAQQAQNSARYALAYELTAKAASLFRSAQVTAGAKSAQGSGNADAERAIRDALEQYQAAFASMSGAAVKRVMPSLSSAEVSSLDRTFVDARTYDVTLEGVRINRSGASARVTCVIRRVIQPRSGEARQITSRAEIALEESEGNWTITRVNER